MLDLQVQEPSLDMNVKDMVSKLINSVKKANSAGNNKADEVKTKLTALERCVVKLEQK
jgi:hypothetical protein